MASVTAVKNQYVEENSSDAMQQPTLDDVMTYQCNICFDVASNPVLTLCGHLYCWSCIAVWIKTLKLQDVKATCPVCRKECDENRNIIPIYGRGDEDTSSELLNETSIPSRPKAQRPEVNTYSMHGYSRHSYHGSSRQSGIGFRIRMEASGNRVFPSFTRIDDDLSTVLIDPGQLGFLCRLGLMIACLRVVISLLS
ncbi:hypothetical protein BDF20DRAFT_678224 [Mycotypha africana]|uniref:uncharacterized protein n=1 Tax=Mycotypha africana TaxID=64632 RepID=UPI0023004B4C|nr:uncharacterized protein BDF20DRAFT_678224 [Mycotypha africana]KAI8971412.1 hypothetical protein BDF20DRAFT_678224 [Mycotypha africana]